MRDDGRNPSDRSRDERSPLGPLPPDLEQRLAEHDERRRLAHEAAAEVTGLPATERPAYVSSHPGCLTPEFVELMIGMARESRGTAPDDSVRYAHLAATAAEASFAAGSDRVDDARALAFAELGNAHRICGDLRRAGIAFGLARERVEFVADPLVEAEVDSLEASYLDYRRDFAQAEELLVQAEDIQREFGCPAAIARLRLKRGGTAQRMGATDKAIELLQTGLEDIDAEAEPRLLIVGIHNLAHALLEADRADDALSLLRRHRGEYDRVGTAPDRARFGWLEARAAMGADLLGLAAASLEDVRDQFIELEMPYEAALVHLDLAEVYARQDSWSKATEAAAITLELCQSCGASQEALAAAQVLLDATRRQRQSAEALAVLTARVRHGMESN